MHRGKIIGALVLVAAIALIVAEEIGGPSDELTGNEAAAGADSLTGQTAGGLAEQVELVQSPAGERVYAVDPDTSEVYWRVYKAGLMARFGHNHVISVGDLEGRVLVTGDLENAEWNLSFTVDQLIVDDPELRARYGDDFASVPSADDKAGTKRNMLTEDVLNGTVYPEILLHGRGFSGTPENAELAVTIEMLGRTIEKTFPASIALDGDVLTINGERRLTHEDFGLKPFKALGGALSVGDDIDFTYRIRAVADGR
jgi:hypothetical protein